MSAPTASPPRPAARPAPRRRGPRLPGRPGRAGAGAPRAAAPLPPGRGSGRATTVLLCGAVLLGALLVALWLNISLSRGSYTQHDLAAQQTQLAEQEQALTEHLQEVSAPAALAASAERLGMVKTPGDTWLVLQSPPEQAVVGEPEVAAAPTASSSASSTPSSAAAQGPVDGDGTAPDAAATTAATTAPATPAATSAPSGTSAGTSVGASAGAGGTDR